jgi:ribose transport system permease protein
MGRDREHPGTTLRRPMLGEVTPSVAADGTEAVGQARTALTERPGSRRRDVLLGQFGIAAALVITCVAFAVLQPDTFLTTDNFTAVLTQSAPLAVVAFGLTVVLVMGDFDLSIAAMASLGGAVAVALMSQQGVAWPLAVLVALLVGVAAGAANGLLTAYANASSFIVTLAAGTIFVGIEYSFTGQETLFESVPLGYTDFGQSGVGGIRYIIILAAVAFVLSWLLLEKTETGRYMRAVGGNAEAARLAGIDVRRLRLAGFVIVAIGAVLAGIMLTAQAGSSSPSQGAGLLLPAFAAAFLGSAAFRSGEFNVAGTLVGVLFLGVIQNGLTLMNADSAAINLVQGGILIAAVLVTRFGGRRTS